MVLSNAMCEVNTDSSDVVVEARLCVSARYANLDSHYIQLLSVFTRVRPRPVGRGPWYSALGA